MAAGALVAAAAAAAFVQQVRAAAVDVWSPWATSHHLTYDPGRASWAWASAQWPRVFGAVDAVPVAVDLVSARAGERGGVRTRVTAVPPTPLPMNAEATREGMFSHIAKFFGADDIRMGDAAFDDAFVLKSTNTALVHDLLTDSVRARLLEQHVERMAYDDGTAHGDLALTFVEVQTMVVDVAQLDTLLALTIELARTRATSQAYR